MTTLPSLIRQRQRRRPGHRPRRHHGGHRHLRIGGAPGLAQGMRVDLSHASGRTADTAMAEIVLVRRGVSLGRARLILSMLGNIDSESQALRLDGPLVADWRALQAELLACGIAADIVWVSDHDQ